MGNPLLLHAEIGFQVRLNISPFEKHRGATAFANFEIGNDAATHPVFNCPRGHPETGCHFQLGQVSFPSRNWIGCWQGCFRRLSTHLNLKFDGFSRPSDRAEDWIASARLARRIILLGGRGGLYCRRRFFGLARPLLLLVDPTVRLVGHLGDQQQVIPAEGVGGFPSVSILVDAAQLYVEPGTGFRFVAPDCSLDRTQPDFMLWFCIHLFLLCCFLLCRENHFIWNCSPKV